MRATALVIRAGVGAAAALLLAATGAQANLVSYDSLAVAGLAITNASPLDINPPADFGFPVAGAGDVNGDGRDDVVVGSQTSPVTGKGNSGIAYVVFGGSTGRKADLRQLGARGFAIEASQSYKCIDHPGSQGCGPSGQKLGWAVAGAGDVNGDGLSDVIVGAPATQVGSKVWTGAAYVVFGKRSSEPVNLDALGSGGFAILGIRADGALGLSVAGLGDMNGDGLSDVAVSQFSPGGGASAFVVFGKRDSTSVSTGSLGAGGFEIRGALPGDVEDVCCHTTPVVVSAAGDVNGDGRADLAVGAPGQSPRGRTKAGSVFVIYGKTDSDPVSVTDLKDLGYAIDGARAQDWTGARVANAGDFNGDGIPDLVLDGPTGDFDPSASGRVWVVYGQRPSTEVDLRALGSQGTTIAGPDGGGVPIAGLGDVNHDGLADVAVAAPAYAPRCRPAVGSAFVVFGRRSAQPISLDLLGLGGYRVDGGAQFDDVSGALAGAGDVNGDGTPDLIGGTVSPSFDVAGSGPSWTARVVFGRTPSARDLGNPRPACFAAEVIPADLASVLRAGSITVQLTSRDPRARTLSIELTDAHHDFYIGRHIRTGRRSVYLVRIPLDRRARTALAGRAQATLRLQAHQLIPANRCEVLFAVRRFGTCPGRTVTQRFTLRRVRSRGA